VVALVIAASAMLNLADGPLDWLGVCDRQDACKTKVRTGVLLAAFLFKFAFDWLESTRPLLRLDKFRDKYLDAHLKPVWETMKKSLRTRNVRLNIMVPKWTWRGRYFKFLYPLGFDPPHNRDRAIRLRVSHGVAGQAFREKRPVFFYFDETWARRNKYEIPRVGWKDQPWGLSEKERDLTSHVRFILSVPMLRSEKEDKQDEVRGVINLDVTEEEAAAALASKPDRIEDASEKLLKIGKLLAFLW
jgi:hypothetical protein